MSRRESQRRWNRGNCGVPRDNHEMVRVGVLAWWGCISPGCEYAGNFEELTAHVVANQFIPEGPKTGR